MTSDEESKILCEEALAEEYRQEQFEKLDRENLENYGREN